MIDQFTVSLLPGLNFSWFSFVPFLHMSCHQLPGRKTRHLPLCFPSSGSFIQWYRQLPGRGPTFLVSAVKGSKEVPDPAGRLFVSEDLRSSALWLAMPRLGDAAVYYCVLAGYLEVVVGRNIARKCPIFSRDSWQDIYLSCSA
uniref:Immunoglobulin V-set domain-containing protein n=1 Tax=Coturnix japonica TaxID=93934 RepID=A0A8C2U6M2_COTJA